MKILFIYTNINGFHADIYSFGLSTIISIAKSNGHDVKVLLVKTEEDYPNVLNEVQAYDPRIIGFSSVSSQFHFVRELSSLIKQRISQSIIVCGGVHPTINPQCVMEADGLDAVFVGESEDAFSGFLKKVEEGRPYKDIDNLAYVEDGKFVMNTLRPLIQDLDAVPFPDRDSIFFEETLQSVGYASFFFSRGCPYLCSYCSNHAIAKRYGLSRNNPRFRSPENCIQEIEGVVKKYALNKIAIADDIFGINKEWRREFCQKYKERINIRFFCLLRANIVDEEFVKLLKDAGCYRISIGVESGNEYIRNTVMQRSMQTDQIIRAFDLCHKHGMQTNALNIIGTPGETEEMIWDTIKLNRRLKPTSSGVNIFYPYKGTKLGDDCFDKGVVNEELYYSFSEERRSSVLNYPEEFKEKLVYYKDNWEDLINRFNVVYWIKKALRSVLKAMHLLDFMIRVKGDALMFIRHRKVAPMDSES